MKTSKKLLSFFLAVVMMVTTCSVGFTAFAAEKDNGIWKDSTSADSTYAALEEMVDTYAPQLFNMERVKNLLEDKLGMTVTDTTSVSDVVAGLAPTLLGLLGGGADKGSIIRSVDSSYTPAADLWYSYLDDDSEDAAMDFYSLYQFCKDNQSSSDPELAKYCKETLNGTADKKGLEEMLKQYTVAYSEYSRKSEDGFNAIMVAFQLVLDAVSAEDPSAENLPIDPSTGEINLDALKVYTFEYNGKTVTVNDLLSYPEFADAQYVLDDYANYFKEIGSDVTITDFSDIIYYIMDYVTFMQDSKLVDETCKYYCRITETDYNEIKDDPTAYQNVFLKGIIIQSGTSLEDYNAAFNDAILTDEEIAKLKADLAHGDDYSSWIGVNSNRFDKYLKSTAENPYTDYPDGYVCYCTLSDASKAYFLAQDPGTKLKIGKAFCYGNDEAGKDLDYYLDQAELYLYTYFYKETVTNRQPDVISVVTACQTAISSVKLAKDFTKFKYSDYTVPPELAVSAVSSVLNGYINQYLDPSDQIGGIITSVVSSLLETNVDLKSTLTDIYLRLYENPVKTIFELLPTVVVMLDELIEPIVFNGEGDNYYNSGNGLLGDVLAGENGILYQYTQAAGSATGIGALRFDLNKVLPDLMHWLTADKDYTFTYYNTVTNDDGSVTYNATTTGKYNLEKTPVITNIYVADKFLQGTKISDIEGMGGEAVAELAAFFAQAVDTYVAEHGNDVKSVASNGSVSNRGINNLFVAVPHILDIMGKNFIAKYGIESDWSYSDHKIKSDKVTVSGQEYTCWSNQSLVDFKNLASGGDAEAILDEFVNIFVNDWFNALVDLLNDTFSTDNKLTSNIPIISSLLNALGGLGENSVLSDVLNGVFQLNYKDDASFDLAVYDKETGYVGLNTSSAYFLISNIGQLVNVILKIDTSKANEIELKFPNDKPGSSSTGAVWGDVPSTTSKSGDSLLSKLDAMLSGVLENSTINNFNLNSTTGILSGVVSLASYFIGSDNSDYMMKLLNGYFHELNDGDKKSTDTSAKNVYTEKTLTNFVVQTYVLIENLIDYYLVNQDAAKLNVFYDSNQTIYSENGEGRYSYNLVAEALKGLISPHAVSKHIDNKAAQAKLANLDSWHNAIKANKLTNGWTGSTNISINWGFRAGNVNDFYTNLGDSLGVIADIFQTLICDTGYYDTILYPVLKDIENAQGVDLGIYAKGTVKDGTTALMSLITPIGNLLNEFYAKPVTVLANLIKGISVVLTKDMYTVLDGVIKPLVKEVNGVGKILGPSVSNLIPSLSSTISSITSILSSISVADIDATIAKTLLGVVKGLDVDIDDATINKVASYFPFSAKTIVKLINSATAKYGIQLPTDLFNQLANCKNAEAVLDYLIKLVVKLITNDDFLDMLKVLINNESVSQLLDMISRLTYDELMNIINAVLAKTTDPTEVYWTFLQYVQEKTTGFYYPAGITAAEADDAVDQLDNVVKSVFALLNGLDVVDQSNLNDLVSGLIFTNDNLTKLASKLYGAIDPYKEYLEYAGIDVSKDGVAKILTDKSYGKTYSSAAKAIKNAKSWNKLSKVNWGFTDGSAKAQQGFINAFAAIFRPFNEVLTLLLAGDNLAIGEIVTELVNNLSVGGSSDTVTFSNGKLVIKVDGNDKYSKTSLIKIDLASVVKEIEDLKLYGGNGYESAIVPLLEALDCNNVKTYSQYKSDIKKSKDNVLIDVLNPIAGFLNDVLEAPFDTLSAVLPNAAYFIDNKGISQLVDNLLSPVTSLLPVLKDNGLNINTIIETFAGKSLNALVTEKLGINIHLDLNNLYKCDIENAVIPLVNKLLKSKNINITLATFKWSDLAKHGEVTTVKSAAKNSQGDYTRKYVKADQGETLIAVLRYIANTLTDNIRPIKSLLGGIDKISDDVMSIINVVLNQVGTASADEIICAIFYFLKEEPQNAFWDYTKYETKEYDFAYPETVDVDFLKNISPMLDGLIGSFINLNDTINKALFKDELIGKMVQGIGKAMEGVKINDDTNLTELLAMTGIDYSTENVAKLLNDSSYGKTYPANASIIASASSWSSIDPSSLKWGVTDRESFFNALCAALRPFYGVLDVLLNDASLGLFDIVYIPGSNGYTSCIVPLLEAFSAYNVKTQYQYRQDINKAYDNILLDIINPIWDKVEDILSAPLQTLMAMLPNLALFIANDGLLQLIENLFTPISALLDALKPIVDVNVVLDKVFDMLGFDLNKTLAKTGLSLNLDIDVYDLTAMLKPIIGVDNIVPLLNQVLGIIKIKGTPLGLELMDIDWFQLASHGEYIKEASQAATYGERIYVKGDASETLIALLRYLVETINYKDNYNTVSSLIGSLIGGSDNETITGTVNQVLGLLQGDTDEVISQLCEVLKTFS